MGRYICDFMMEQNQQEFFNRAHQLLTSMGYEYVTFKGEEVFKKGNGWISAPTFFKISYSGTTVRMEAWLKTALLPGVYVGEHGVDGVWGFAVKEILKGRVAQLEQLIMSMGARPLGTPIGVIHTTNQAPQAIPAVQAQTQPQQAVTGGNFCTNCGKALPQGSAFCSECGKAVKR